MLKQLANPLTVTLGLLALALLLLALRRRRTGLVCVVAAFAWTYLLATPAISDALRADLEGRFPPSAIDRIPAADAIVVLGGGVHPPAPPRPGPDLRSAADRVWLGAELYNAGKAPLVVATGARPYTDSGPTAADAQAAILAELGVPTDAIVRAGDSTSTHTDALAVAAIADERGLDRVLLVTSALHMPRAMATFQEAGIPVFPAPADFEVTEVPWSKGNDWLPDSGAFAASSRALQEYIGMAWYRFRGWM